MRDPVICKSGSEGPRCNCDFCRAMKAAVLRQQDEDLAVDRMVNDGCPIVDFQECS